MNMKSKKIVSFLTALILISGGTCFPETSTSIFNFSTTVSAASTYGDLVYVIYNGKVIITDCDESVTEVEIPSEIEGYPVNTIGNSAFKDCKRLTSITIPDSVTFIGDSAFDICGSLTSVTIPYSVTSIGKAAFSYCTGLTSVTIPDSVTSIGKEAFLNCTALTSVTIPNSVTSIGVGAFYRCLGLKSIKVDENNASYSDIDGILFNKDKTILISYPCDKGKTNKTFIIPNSVKTISAYVFYDCPGLTSITIPDSVTRIDTRAFFISSLTSISIPKSVEFIGERSLGYTPSGPQIENFKIYGYSNSSAEYYADTNGFEFINIESEPVVTEPITTTELVTTTTPVVTTKPVTTTTPIITTKPVTTTTPVVTTKPVTTTTPVSTTALTTTTISKILYGDANMDNKIDNVDLVTLCQALTKEIVLDSAQILRSDLNNDGAIDVADVATLKQYILGDKVTLGPKNN